MQYWPKEVGSTQHFRAMTVSLEEVTDANTHVTRKLLLKNGLEERVLYHFQFMVWPDHGVPTDTAAFIKFRDEVWHALKRVGCDVDSMAGARSSDGGW